MNNEDDDENSKRERLNPSTPWATQSILRSPVWWLLVGVFALEFFLFDRFGARPHTRYYPHWHDQIQYLSESYEGYEYAREHGLLPALWQSLTNRSAQGTLHDFFGIIAFRIAGPSRSAALALNLLALVAWQASLFFAISHTSKSRALGFASALLPIMLCGPWEPIPGSAFDFRLDHLAMCAIGVTATLAVLSDGFRSRRVSLLFGAAIGVTLLTRFLTGTYFIVLGGLLALWAMRGPERNQRMINLACASFMALLIAGPILWLNRATVYEYYWIGHYVGPESAIRSTDMGFGRSLAFVWGHLGQRHVGMFFGAVSVLGAIALVCTHRTEPARTSRFPAIIGALFFFAPTIVLTLHRQKSEVVLSALVPGLVLLVAATWSLAARRSDARARGIFAVIIAVAALVFYARAQLRPIHPPATEHDLRLVNALADEFFDRARRGNLTHPAVSVDCVLDCLDARVLRLMVYERHHVFIASDMRLPTGIAEPDEATVFARLRESDFVFLTEDAPEGLYPFDRKLATMRPQLRAWCDSHLRVAHQFNLFGRRMLLYQRREIPFP